MAKYPASVFEDAYNKIVDISGKYPGRMTILRMESIVAAKMMDPNKKFHLIFIDGDHSYEGVSSDIDAWISHVEPGGILCGHDYNNIKRGFWGVKQAVLERFKEEEIGLGDDHTWFHRV
jgi:hypothetical protein